MDVLHQVDELRPTLDQIIPSLKENGISGKVLMHCDLKDLKSVLNLPFGPWEIFQLLVTTLRSVEKVNVNQSNQYVNGPGVGSGDGFDQIETGPLPAYGGSSGSASSTTTSNRPKGQTVIEKQVRYSLGSH